MHEKLINTLKTVNMLYIIEEDIEDDYHLMPFRIICDHITLADFDKAWEKFITIKPAIVLVHAVKNADTVVKLVKKIRQSNSKSSIIILTDKPLEEKLTKLIDEDIQKLVTHPVTYEELIVSLENSIDYDNLHYSINKDLIFEPTKSAMIIKGVSVSLTNKETKLLTILIQNKERIVTYSEIENYVWEDESMSRNTLTSIIANIRKKAQIESIIKNYSNQGYQITAS